MATHLAVLCLCIMAAVTLTVSRETTITIPMPSPRNRPKHNDYKCAGVSLPNEDAYIISYEPQADPRVVHHMLMFGCPGEVSDNTWSCKSVSDVCPHRGMSKTLYAWALNASGLQLPQDVGMQIGPSVRLKSLVVQIHYGHPETVEDLSTASQQALTLRTTQQKQKNVAGIFLMGGYTSLAPGRKEAFSDSSCIFSGPNTIHPFAFRTHAHSLGHQIVGYIVKPDGKWELIGTRSPQDAQTFYPAVSDSLEVHQGDTLAARCVFNTMKKTHTVQMGPDSEDEMCNFYIMYYTANNGRGLTADDCWGSVEDISFPSSLPPLPQLVSHTEHHHHGGMGGNKQHEEDEDEDDYKCPVPLPPGSPSKCLPPVTTPPPFIEGVASPGSTPIGLVQAEDWLLNKVTIPDKTLGQVSAVAVDAQSNVHILHRASVQWDYWSFNGDFTYAHTSNGPIKEPTLLMFTASGNPLQAWGDGLFYLPHGLTIDSQGAFWVTDVAMHQVFKFDTLGDSSPSLTLGIAFKPGDGFGHFCQPASVAVETSGVFYVADGYCNRRVLKFSADGTLLETWDSPVSSIPLYIPHKASLNHDESTLYVADRENNRVLTYSTETGTVSVFSGPFKSAIYAVWANGSREWPIYGVFGGEEGSMGFSLDSQGDILDTWGPSKGFSKPHDITVDPASGAVYVTEIGPNRIWKFAPLFADSKNVPDVVVPTAATPPSQPSQPSHPTQPSHPSQFNNETTNSPNTTASVESADNHHGLSDIDKEHASVNIGIFVAIFVVVFVIIIIVIGILREHKYLKKLRLYVGSKRRTARAKEVGGVGVETRGKKGIPLQSLLGPSRPGFSRLKTYDSDSEDEEFPVFNRV